MTTPPGISPETFAEALREFVAVVGNEWVFTTEEDVALYRDAYSPLRDLPDERVASAAVAPATVEEVQAVVRIANRHAIPLYTISTGKNLGYGGSAPNYSGSVVLDLKRMNRIIEVDDSRHFAIVEPGVSYFDLYNFIQERGMKVWIDCPDPGWGSLIGNALDHGVGHSSSRFRNHFDAHCGMEVVLADGEIMRTGMGALPGAETWAQFKNGFGPIIDGIFSQSNFGIVTKMGFWLMPQPEAFLHAAVLAPRYEDLHAVVELLKYLENSGIATGAPEISSPLLGTGTSEDFVESFYNAPPQLNPRHAGLIAESRVGYSRELEQYGIEKAIPYWKLSLTFYGPAKVVAAQWEAVQDMTPRTIANARFEADPIRTDAREAVAKRQVYAQNLGVPNLEFFAFGTRANGNPSPFSGHMWFSPIIPQTAEAVIEANRVFDDAIRTLPALQNLPILGLRPFASPFTLFERSFALVLGFPVTDDPKQNQAIVEAFRELIRIAAAHGWGEYRTPAIFQDQVMGVMSNNDHSLLRFHETVKDAVDPKGILSPGRYGIWPKHLRSKAQ